MWLFRMLRAGLLGDDKDDFSALEVGVGLVKAIPLGEPRVLHFGNDDGHRREYQELFIALFDLAPIVGRVGRRNIRALLRARSVLFGTIEDHYIGFVVVALLRAILGLPTVGLFLRPQRCFKADGTLRRTLKGWFFSALKRVQRISVCTIIPFAFAPHYAKVARFGVMDPHMWDKLKPSSCAHDADLAAWVIEQARGRRVLAFLGGVTPIKGAEFLMSLLRHPEWPEDKFFVVIAGKVSAECANSIQHISRSRALVIDRMISDVEFDTLYSYSDWIWACYRPDYDQASGIFGRALQFGKVPILRKGSLVDQMATTLCIDQVCLDFGRIERAIDAIIAVQNSGYVADKLVLAQWKNHFVQTFDLLLKGDRR